jgi:hypothetical protein
MSDNSAFVAAGTIYVLGGNDSSLAYVTGLRPSEGLVTAWLVSLAWTPVGAVAGTGRQKVGIAADRVAQWADRTFPASDEQAFVSSPRDLDLLLRTGWEAAEPGELSDRALINPEDVPEEVLDALAGAPAPLAPCAVCRRLCVQQQFVRNERQLCAWDYHAAVFGRRGPWRTEPYDQHLFESLPSVPYVSALLLAELNVDAVLATSDLSEAISRTLVNTAIAGGASFMAVRTEEGLTLLRERAP